MEQGQEPVARSDELPGKAEACEGAKTGFAGGASLAARNPLVGLRDKGLTLGLEGTGPGICIAILDHRGNPKGFSGRNAPRWHPAQGAEEEEVHIRIGKAIALAKPLRGIVFTGSGGLLL